MSDNYTTQSGREVKRVGNKEGTKTGLAALRAAREGGAKRTDQYQVEEAKRVFEEIDADEYDDIQEKRKNDDFIVDDDGYGYRDHGGEIWDRDDHPEDGGKKKRRKLDPNEQQITNFMMPQSTIRKQGPLTSTTQIKQKPKVSVEQSKDMLNNLFQDLDNKDPDDLVDINASAALSTELNKPVAFNKEEELMNKYAVRLESRNEVEQRRVSEQIQAQNSIGQNQNNANPFSKKRKLDEISQTKRESNDNNTSANHYYDAKSHQTVDMNQSNDESHFDYMSAKSHNDSNVRMSVDTTNQRQQNQVSNQSNSGISYNKTQAPNAASNDEYTQMRQANFKENQEFRNMDANLAQNQQEYPLPLNENGTLSFYWIDAHEENNGADLFIFGKIYQPEVRQYVSCSIKVNGMQRVVFALPKMGDKARGALTKEEEEQKVRAVQQELNEIKNKRFPQITKWRSKGVTRKYAFEMPIQHGEHQFVKIKYDSTMPILQNVQGKTFETLFGTNQSMLELFILKRKIKGPCWMTVQNPQKSTDFRKTWCRQEIFVNNPKHIEVTLEDLNRQDVPPLTSLTFSFKTTRAQQNTNEIAMISCLINSNINQEGPSQIEKNQSFTLMRKLDGKPWPFDIMQRLKQKQDQNIQKFDNERQMIEAFIARLFLVDPDLMIAHNLTGGMFDLLLARIQYLKINHWSRIGRLKKTQIPNKKLDQGSGYGGSQWIPRQVTCGRLLVDTFLSAKELIRETNYDLTYLAKVQLKKDRQEFDDDLLPKFYLTSEHLFSLVDHTEKDAFLTVQLMNHLSIIPLTKQLTNIAGNLWFRSLQNARAERNELLLLHEFKKKKFILPDKKIPSAKDMRKSMFGGEDEGMIEAADNQGKGKKGGKRKKAAYAGGLVIEPKAGFYDNIILLLDFNSLYPSIIQEYNLCFTTVNRRPTKNFDGSEIKNKFQSAGVDAGQDEVEEADLPDKSVNTKDAVLPNVLRDLVQKRKQVKDRMKNEKDQVKLQQLEIRQKAIKLTANSMYGCLGFGSSRFHAQAIAALITKTGRDTLLNTKSIAEEKLGFDVVYGDTDSIMINTGTNQLQQSLEMGKRLKSEVNCLYKCLEIEIDGVFKSLLLLKKKKYAALKYENFGTADAKVVQEVKGLDMVRRDWCGLSKEVGNYVLSQILSGKQREEVVLNLNEFLTNIGESMKNGRITLDKFIITKQLTKAIADYSDIKGQPHVAVAKRQKQAGKSEADLVNNFIPYVIGAQPFDPNQTNPALADKAYHPDEMMTSKGKVELDIEWYITMQILPPITRLIEHIDGIDVEFVAQCLGVDPKKYKYHSDKKNNDANNDEGGLISNPILQTETERSLKGRTIAELIIKCPFCTEQYHFPGIFQEGKNKDLTGLNCIKCGQRLPDAYVLNRVTLFLKQLLTIYYQGTKICEEPSCQATTRQLLYHNKCVNLSCKGKMTPEYTEIKTNDTLRYLQGLFNVRKYIQENQKNGQQNKKVEDIPNFESFQKVMTKVDSVMDRSKFNKVDLSNIFSFMKISGAK